MSEYKSYGDFYDNGPGSENFKRSVRQSISLNIQQQGMTLTRPAWMIQRKDGQYIRWFTGRDFSTAKWTTFEKGRLYQRYTDAKNSFNQIMKQRHLKSPNISIVSVFVNLPKN